MAPKIGALIAAAGEGRRMGYPKALLKIQGRSLLFTSAETLLALRLEKLLISLPLSLFFAELAHELRLRGARICPNLYPKMGYAGSIKTIMPLCDGLFGIIIAPVDAPLVSIDLLRVMLASAREREHEPTIIVPHCESRPGHPVYLSHHFFSDLERCHQLGGLRGLIQQKKSHRCSLLWPDERILYDLNSWIDLADKGLV